MFLKNNLILIFFLIISCQPVEVLRPVDIDNSKYEKISINAKEIIIEIKYNPVFSKENIEDKIYNSPIKILNSWNNENINKFGNENKLKINILDASILKKEIENVDAKKYEEKTIFKYEVFFLVEYQLYDDSDILISNVTVESSRSTTSQKYISLNETEIIINDLLINALKDFTNETKLLLNIYMSEYLK
tara:strand:- start:395 stop:964 length:570 start_codon:yes stop_codon:yes gene_type:complete